MIRPAQRPLTGKHRHPHDCDVRYGRHAEGIPAVTVDLQGWNRTRTFADPAALTKLARELDEAAEWLTTEQMFGPQQEAGG